MKMNAGWFVCLIVFLCEAWVFAQAEVCNFVSSQNEKWIQLDRGATLACDGSFTNPHWWKSKECDITSFSQHFGCDEEHCRVTPDDYVNGFFYYCCTKLDVLPNQAATNERTCFQISVCTEITSSYVQEYVIFGTKGTAYVELNAQSTPTSQVTSFSMEQHSVDFTTETRGSSPYHSYIHTFDVPDVDNGTVIELTIQYTTSSTCQSTSSDRTVTEYVTVIKELGPQIEPVACTNAVDSNTPLMQTPTPSVVSGSCECQSEGFHDSDAVLCLLGFFLLLCVCIIIALIVCVIWLFRVSRSRSTQLSKGPSPYSTVQIRRMDSNGSTAPFTTYTETPMSNTERSFPPRSEPSSSPPSYDDGGPQYATLNSPVLNDSYGRIHRLPQQQGQRIAMV